MPQSGCLGAAGLWVLLALSRLSGLVPIPYDDETGAVLFHFFPLAFLWPFPFSFWNSMLSALENPLELSSPDCAK